MKVPEGLLYTKQHEWIRIEGDEGTVGITDYAQNELGDVVFVELPNTGDEFQAEDTFGTVESVKAVSEVYCPVAGKVVGVNSGLSDAPEQVNEDPYGEGWMIRLQMADSTQQDQLMKPSEYEKFLEEEAGE